MSAFFDALQSASVGTRPASRFGRGQRGKHRSDAKEEDDSTWHPKPQDGVHENEVYFGEQPEVLVLMQVLRNAVTSKFERIPALIAAFVDQALTVLLTPSHDLYKSVNRFLLQRPALDVGDVPMLYALLNSSTSHHQDDRMWMLRLLHHGVRSSNVRYSALPNL